LLCCNVALVASAPAKYVPNQLIIQTDSPVLSAESVNVFSDDIINDPDFESVQPIQTTHKAKHALRATRFTNQKYHSLVFLKPGIDPEQVAKRWQSKRAMGRRIDFVQPNYLYSVSVTTPNDPGYAKAGFNDFIRITSTNVAWDYVTGNSSIVIAVVDTGVNSTGNTPHEDLASQLWVNPGEVVDGIDNDGNGFIDDINGFNFVNVPNANLTDEFGHGIHVAGIIAAAFNNGKGIAGVCPGCRIMGVRAGDKDGSFTSVSLGNAIDYAVDQGARIINMSLGGNDSNDTLFKNAVANASRSGVVIVVAAGNERSSLDLHPQIPSKYPGVIVVSATNGTTFDSTYSNYGSVVALSAPGTAIFSTYTPDSDSYAGLTGTSMATPVVSGIAGLLLSAAPQLSTQSVKTLLTGYAIDLGSPGKDNFYGYGLVQAGRMIQAIATDTTGPTISVYVSEITRDAGATFSVTASDNVVGTPDVTVTLNYRQRGVTISSVSAVITALTPSRFVVTVPTPDSGIDELSYAITATDILGNTSHYPCDGCTASVPVVDRNPPVISTPSSFVDDQMSGTLKVIITDSSGIASSSIRARLTSANGDILKTIVANPTSFSLTVPTLSIALGDFGFTLSDVSTMSIYAEDVTGNGVTANIPLSSRQNPTIAIGLQPNDYVSSDGQFPLSIFDDNGVSLNSLSIRFETSTTSVTVRYHESPSAFTVLLPSVSLALSEASLPAAETVTVTVTVADPFGNISTQSIHVRTSRALFGNSVSQTHPLLIYPNPFNPTLSTGKFAYHLSRSASSGTIYVYDLGRKKVRTITIPSNYLTAGYQEVDWDGKDDSGTILPNGGYFIVAVFEGTSRLILREKAAILR
ncbi:hypothetical protein EBR96_06495, partial [bacterium]|nr:hypothetical protein [bacterium]